MKNYVHSFLLVIGLFLSFAASAQQPNILFYIIDDVGVGPIPDYLPNSTKANMPNLEALMTEGVTFDQVWANPVCSPSRATILTGKYGFRTNVLNPTTLSQLSTSETTLHDYIDQASNGAYASSLIGKWHLSGTGNNDDDYPAKCGIPYYAGNLGGGLMDYNQWSLTINGQTTTDTRYASAAYTDLAVDWINSQTKPWFCWVAHNTPHTPFHVPPAGTHSQGNLPTDQDSIDANPFPYYLAMLENADYEMGRLLDSLPQSVRNNTVIIFVGDNGTQRNVLENPYSRRQGKGSLYQGGIHVPMVIAGAGVTRNDERESALINFTDLFATIVELTGTSLPSIHDSKSFLPLLTTSGPSIRTCAYSEAIAMGNSTGGWTTRDETYKLIRFDNGDDEFYNLISDPYEKNDLLLGTLTPGEQTAFDNLENCNPQNATAISSLLNKSLFLLYPNPVKAEMFVEWGANQPVEYLIANLLGRQVHSGILNPGQNRIQFEAIPSGVYIMKAGQTVQKFVKE